MNYADVLNAAGVYDDSLRADDPRFANSTLIVMDDGSIFLTDSSFLMEMDDWLVMFSEHHSYRLYHKTDVVSFAHLNKNSQPIEELK